MQVFIKTLTGNTITLDCDSIDNLKQQIFEREGLEIDRQRLNYGGKELESESLSNGITIHLSSRINGGKKKKKKEKKKSKIMNESKKKIKSEKWSGVKKQKKYTLMNFLRDMVIPLVVSLFITWQIVNEKATNASLVKSTLIVATLFYAIYYASTRLTSIYSKGIFIVYAFLLFVPLMLKYVYNLKSFVYIEPPEALICLVAAIFLLFYSNNLIILISGIVFVLTYIFQRYFLQSTQILFPSAQTALIYSFFITLGVFVFLIKML